MISFSIELACRIFFFGVSNFQGIELREREREKSLRICVKGFWIAEVLMVQILDLYQRVQVPFGRVSGLQKNDRNHSFCLKYFFYDPYKK